MNSKVLLISIALLAGLFFTSCDQNKVAKPVISIMELGIGNSHVAYLGANLHIEAEIVAEGTIDKITVEIHQEEGSKDEIVEYFTDYSGKKNTTFHKHVDIPSTLKAGAYHFHMIVTDKEGNETTAEEEITIEELVDTEAPALTFTSTPEIGKVFLKGQTISISGKITDNTSLEGLVVALVKESDNIADDKVNGANTSVIVMLHTHDFSSPNSHSFTASIVVGATNDNNMTPAVIQGNNAWRTGNYYILVKSKDAKGNWATSKHYPIVINL